MSKADKIKKRLLRRRVVKLQLPGRDRHSANRKPSGRIVTKTKRETQEDVLATALGQPHRAGTSDPRSRYNGTLIGKLVMLGVEGEGITQIQFRAAEHYAGLRARYLNAIGSARETAKAMDPSQEQTSRALWTNIIADEDQLQAEADTIEAWSKCEATLQGMSIVLHGFAGAHRLGETVRMAIVEDRMRDIGDFRSGMNALAHLWGIKKTEMW